MLNKRHRTFVIHHGNPKEIKLQALVFGTNRQPPIKTLRVRGHHKPESKNTTLNVRERQQAFLLALLKG